MGNKEEPVVTRPWGETLLLNVDNAPDNLKQRIENIHSLPKVAQLKRLALANNISLHIRGYKKYDLDELLVWLDTVKDRLYMPLPDGIIFTGFTLTNILDFMHVLKSCKCSEPFLRSFIGRFGDKFTEAHWRMISGYQKLSSKFIKDFQDKIDWKCISSFQDLSDNFIEEFKEKIDWKCLGMGNEVPETIIRRYPDKIEWGWESLYKGKPNSFFEEFSEYIQWNLPCILKKDEDFLCEYFKYIDLKSASQHSEISGNFIRKFKDLICWDRCSMFQKLSEDSIREFKDRVNWNYISAYQVLSENFIREFKDKVNWTHISYNQKLSEDFIREFKDRVSWRHVFRTPRSKEFIEEFHNQVEGSPISVLENLRMNFKPILI
jgi:hypothetical protein